MTDEFSYDLDEPQEDEEVMLFLVRGDDCSRMLARRHWFDEGKGLRTEAWQCTVTGERVTFAKPYAWAPAPMPPDLAGAVGPTDPTLPFDEAPPVEAEDEDQRLPPEVEENEDPPKDLREVDF